VKKYLLKFFVNWLKCLKLFKYKILIFVAKKKVGKKLFSHSSFVAVAGSGIRHPGWIKIRIRDKHPESATLLATNGRFHYIKYCAQFKF
jgi:hypothetical protein